MYIIHIKWMYRCTLNDAFKQSPEREESPEHVYHLAQRIQVAIALLRSI